jgi:hypothetical protein
MKRVTDAQIAQALRIHFNFRTHAAKALGICVQRVQRYAEAHNVPQGWVVHKATNSKVDKVLQALAENGNDRVVAAKIVGAHVGNVYRIARLHKIPLSPRPKVGRKPPVMPLVRWDADNVAKLRDMYLKVPTPSKAEMAAAFNTTESSIQTVLSRKGLVRNAAITGAAWKNEKLPLNCLCCRRPFVSEGIHNRQCPRCFAENSEMAA